MNSICLLTALAFLLQSAVRASFPSTRVHLTEVLACSNRGVAITSGTVDASAEALRSIVTFGSLTSIEDHDDNHKRAFNRLAFLRRHLIENDVSWNKLTTKVNTDQVLARNDCNPLSLALIIRGGASSNTVQNVMRSILESTLPAPIKQLIRMICKLLEDLTGWKILPENNIKSKAKKQKSKEKILVEEVSLKRKTTKSRRSKSRKTNQEDKTIPLTQSKVEADGDEDTESEKELPSSIQSSEKATNTKMTPATPPAPKPKTDAASKKFLSNNLKSSNPNYRIQRELKEFISSPPPGLSVKISGKNVRLWIITLTMPENTIYAGETYKLRVQFPSNYPTSPPSVYFLPPTPRHEHVYTNGDICLSLLGKDWRPIMTAQSLAQAIMSILCGAQRKSLPMDNSRHAGNKPGQRQDDWVYHDDNC